MITVNFPSRRTRSYNMSGLDPGRLLNRGSFALSGFDNGGQFFGTGSGSFSINQPSFVPDLLNGTVLSGIYGQSLSIGSDTGAASEIISRYSSSRHGMLNGGPRPHYDQVGITNVNFRVDRRQIESLRALKEQKNYDPGKTNFAETFAYGMGLHLEDQHIFFTMGRGAYRADQLNLTTSDGVIHFDNLYAGFKRSRDLIHQAGGFISGVAPLSWKQMEADGAASTPKATHKNTLIDLQSNVEDCLKHALRDNSVSIPFMIDQIGYQDFAHTDADLCVGAIELHRTNPKFFCVGPTYWMPYFVAVNDVHFQSIGYRVYGEHWGRVKAIIRATGTWDPCHILGALRTGTQVDVSVWVPEPPLRFHPSMITAIANHGFTWAPGTITTPPTVTDDGTSDHIGNIRFNISNDEPGVLGYAYENGSNQRNGPTVGSRGTVCDSSAFVTLINGLNIPHFLCNDQWVVA